MTSDVMTNTETPYPELSVRSSSLLQELTSLPLVQSMGSAYTRMRDSNWVLKSGLGLVEDTCSVVVDKIHIGSAFGMYSFCRASTPSLAVSEIKLAVCYWCFCLSVL